MFMYNRMREVGHGRELELVENIPSEGDIGTIHLYIHTHMYMYVQLSVLDIDNICPIRISNCSII